MKLYLDGYYLEGTPEECLEFEMRRQGVEEGCDCEKEAPKEKTCT